MPTTINDAFAELGDLSPQVIVALVLLILNLVLRRFKYCPNWIIPSASIVLGMVGFAVLVPPQAKEFHPLGRNLCEGFIVGAVAWLAYGQIVTIAEKRFPWLADVINGPSEPKPETENKNP